MSIDALDEGRCTGCGICFSACPQDVFRLDRKTGREEGFDGGGFT